MASGITLKSTNDSIVNIKNVGTTTGTTEVTVPNRNMTMGTEITLGTAQATTSGTFKNFTIPSGVKRVTVMFNGVSTNGTSSIIMQIGDSGGIETNGYIGNTFHAEATGLANTQWSTYIPFSDVHNATYTKSGAIRVSKINATSYSIDGTIGSGTTARIACFGGSKTLSAELATVRITTVNGTDTFDAGMVNVSWEF